MRQYSRNSPAVPSRITNCFSKSSPCGFIPAKTILARALMPRQPYSVAVKSDRRSGYIPNPYGRDLGLGYRVRTPSSQEGDRGVEKIQ